MSLGVERKKVRLCPHSPEWARDFAEEAARIRTTCGDLILAMEHVGSTSIPGIYAKPVIDICIAVRGLEVANEMIEPMASIGYDFPGDIGILGEVIFGRDPEKRKFLVHAVVAESIEWFQYLKFRDAMRSDDAIAAQYSELKQELAAKYADDHASYNRMKSGFIDRVKAGLPKA